MREKYTESQVLDLLRHYHRKDWRDEREWAFFTHVRTPWNVRQTREADAVAMNMWASKEFAVHGFEVKVSRSDWRREIEQPTKWLGIGGWCSRWTVVAPAGVVKLEEVPEPWGALVIDGDWLKVMKRAPKLEPKPLSAGFVAALVRRFSYDEEDKARARSAREEALRRAIFGDPDGA